MSFIVSPLLLLFLFCALLLSSPSVVLGNPHHLVVSEEDSRLFFDTAPADLIDSSRVGTVFFAQKLTRGADQVRFSYLDLPTLTFGNGGKAASFSLTPSRSPFGAPKNIILDQDSEQFLFQFSGSQGFPETLKGVNMWDFSRTDNYPFNYVDELTLLSHPESRFQHGALYDVSSFTQPSRVGMLNVATLGAETVNLSKSFTLEGFVPPFNSDSVVLHVEAQGYVIYASGKTVHTIATENTDPAAVVLRDIGINDGGNHTVVSIYSLDIISDSHELAIYFERSKESKTDLTSCFGVLDLDTFNITTTKCYASTGGYLSEVPMVFANALDSYIFPCSVTRSSFSLCIQKLHFTGNWTIIMNMTRDEAALVGAPTELFYVDVSAPASPPPPQVVTRPQVPSSVVDSTGWPGSVIIGPGRDSRFRPHSTVSFMDLPLDGRAMKSLGNYTAPFETMIPVSSAWLFNPVTNEILIPYQNGNIHPQQYYGFNRETFAFTRTLPIGFGFDDNVGYVENSDGLIQYASGWVYPRTYGAANYQGENGGSRSVRVSYIEWKSDKVTMNIISRPKLSTPVSDFTSLPYIGGGFGFGSLNQGQTYAVYNFTADIDAFPSIVTPYNKTRVYALGASPLYSQFSVLGSNPEIPQQVCVSNFDPSYIPDRFTLHRTGCVETSGGYASTWVASRNAFLVASRSGNGTAITAIYPFTTPPSFEVIAQFDGRLPTLRAQRWSKIVYDPTPRR